MKHHRTYLATVCLAFAGSFTASFSATAAPITQPVVKENWTPNSATLSWSNLALAATNAIGGQIDKSGLAKQSAAMPVRMKYVNMMHNMPLTSFTFDDADGKLLKAQFTGGFTLSAENDRLTTTGGAITIDNLLIDFQAQKVFANVNNGTLGLLEHVALWTFTGATGHATASGTAVMSIPTLAITAEGFAILDRGLNLLTDGEAAWSKVGSFGSITSAVPEPGTYATMLLGMAGLAAVVSRKRRNPS